jgi:hypothetical protein
MEASGPLHSPVALPPRKEIPDTGWAPGACLDVLGEKPTLLPKLSVSSSLGSTQCTTPSDLVQAYVWTKTLEPLKVRPKIYKKIYVSRYNGLYFDTQPNNENTIII